MPSPRPNRRVFIGGLSAALIAGAAPRRAWAQTQADVIVIGAGLAGLHVASLLERAGLRVLVIEGEARLGGRLHTLRDLPGAPEAGGIQVGQGYRRLRAIAADLGIAITGAVGAGAGAVDSGSALFNIRGRTVRAADWPDADVNQLVGAERQQLPLALARYHGGALPQLAAPDAWRDSDPALDISYAAALRAHGASDEAVRLIGANLNGNDLTELSVLSLARSLAIFRAGPGPTGLIAGGSQALPEAMGRSLSSPIRLNQRVTGIAEETGHVAVSTDQGTIHARHVLCTIPFAALRHLPITGPLAPSIATLIPSLAYTRASFAYLSAASPFWREDGEAETLWTDDPLIGRVFVLGDNPPMLKLWTTGPGSDLLDRMAPTAAADAIIRRIEAMRPSATGKLRVLRLFSWQKQAGARAIYHHIGTGQAAALAAATRDSGQHLHFAGEHLAIAASGMEGALESAENAARTILSRQ